MTTFKATMKAQPELFYWCTTHIIYLFSYYFSGETRVNYYSDDTRTLPKSNLSLGDAHTDNARVLRERRFLMASLGDESRSCKDGSAGAGPRMKREEIFRAFLTVTPKPLRFCIV